MTSELIVVGGGPGGHAAAMEAASLGLSVTLVQSGPLGGACLNWGCIPTKLFLGATAALPELEAQARLRLIDPASFADLHRAFSLPALQERKRRLLAGTHKALEKELAAAGVRILRGRGRILGPGRLELTPEDGAAPDTLAFDLLVLATGSRPAFFPGLEPDGAAVLDSNQLLDLEQAPESLLLVGGGAIGLELGEFFQRLGARVTLVEAMDRVAPAEDPEVGQTLGKMLKRSGWELHLGRGVQDLRTDGGQAVLTFADGVRLQAEKALVAVGRLPNSQGLGLENVDAATAPKGWIVTDDQLQTAPRVYAIGDCNGRTLLAHAAAHQGRYAARHAAGREKDAYAPGPMPSCIYGSHEVMRTGSSLAALQAQGPVLQSRTMLAANAIAQSHGASQGFVKVFWQEGRVRGIVAVGHGVSHLSTAASLIVAQGWDAERAASFVFAHPTLDESLAAALLAGQSPA